MADTQPLLRNGYDADLLPPYASLRMAAKPIVDEQRALMRSTSDSSANTLIDQSPSIEDSIRFDDGGDGPQSWNVGGQQTVLLPQSMWRPEVAASVMRDRLQQQQQQTGGSAGNTGHKGRQFVSSASLLLLLDECFGNCALLSKC